jgi:hypothetical protein
MAHREQMPTVYSNEPGFGYPGVCHHYRPQPEKPLGCVAYWREPVLVFEPGHQYGHALYRDGHPTNVLKVNINGTGFVAIPTTAVGPQGPTGRVANVNIASFPVGNGGEICPLHLQ